MERHGCDGLIWEEHVSRGDFGCGCSATSTDCGVVFVLRQRCFCNVVGGERPVACTWEEGRGGGGGGGGDGGSAVLLAYV